MRLQDASAPWLIGLPPNPSPAAVSLAKQMWEAQTGAPSPAHYTPPNLAAPPPAYDPGVAGAVGVGPAPGVASAPPAADPANDPAYQALLASLTRDRHDAIVNFGDASGTGADADTAAQAGANPYSVTHQLGNTLSHNLQGVNDTANQHGVLFSGANLQGQQNELAAGQQRSYAARQTLLQQLNSLADQQSQGYAAAYGRLAGAA